MERRLTCTQGSWLWRKFCTATHPAELYLSLRDAGKFLLLSISNPFHPRNLTNTIYPAGIWCQNDVGSTSMRRHHVASTLIRRHFGTKCPLGIYLGSDAACRRLESSSGQPATEKLSTQQYMYTCGHKPVHPTVKYLSVNFFHKVSLTIECHSSKNSKIS